MNKILLQSLATVSIAVLVYLFKSFLDTFFFDPKKEYNKIRAKISTALIFYSDKYSNPSIYGDLGKEGQKSLRNARKELRKLASDLYGFSEYICWITRGICRIPDKSDLNTVSKNLIGLSNGLTKAPQEKKAVKFNLSKASNIQKLLKITKLE